MEALKKNTVGYAVAAFGALVALVGGLADTLGIGAEGADGLGGKQLALLLVGLVILAAGLAVVFLSAQEGELGETASETDTDTEDSEADTEDTEVSESADAD